MGSIELLKPYGHLFQTKPKSRYTIITGGRASAKSFHVALAVLNLTYQPNQVILYSRYTMTSAHDSIIPEFREKIELLGVYNDFEVNKADIINKKTGSRILFRGIKTSSGNQTAKLKSIQGLSTFVLEEAEEAQNGTDFETIDDSVRTVAVANRVWVIMNPSFKTHYFYREFIAPKREDVTHIHTNYRINRHNLSPSILAKIDRMREVNPARYQHIYLGEWLDEADGLLWNRSILERQRIATPPELQRTIVAIDPATTKTMSSDETGITVQGRAGEHGYLLEDLSGKYSPQEWAAAAVQAAKTHKADAIVAEKNQGGDMVEAVIRQVDRNIRVILVNATKSKAVRAEPIYGLYEQGRIWHVGQHPKLEQQMVTFNPDSNKDSPDRVDALVWGFSELMLKKQKSTFAIS